MTHARRHPEHPMKLDPEALEKACKAFAPEISETVACLHYETEWARLQRKMTAAILAWEAHKPKGEVTEERRVLEQIAHLQHDIGCESLDPDPVACSCHVGMARACLTAARRTP